MIGLPPQQRAQEQTLLLFHQKDFGGGGWCARATQRQYSQYEYRRNFKSRERKQNYTK
jgi:hypothetical protein